MNRILIVLPLLFLLFAFVPDGAQAQGEGQIEVTELFDFTVDEGGWVPGPDRVHSGSVVPGWTANYVPGVGWQAMRRSEIDPNATSNEERGNNVRITYNFASTVEISYLRFDYFYGSYGSSTKLGYLLHYPDGSVVESAHSNEKNFNDGIFVDAVSVFIQYNDQYDPNHDPKGLVYAAELRYIKNIDAYTKPLRTDYLVANYYTDFDTTVGRSDMPYRHVHAPTDGDVIAIQPTTAPDGYLVPDASELYKVIIRDLEDKEWTYFVRNAPDYVKFNEAVTAGCIMGESQTTATQEGWTAASRAEAEGQPIAVPPEEFVTEPPLDAAPCSSIESQICLTELDQADWSVTGGHTWQENTVTLQPGARAQQLVSLPTDRFTGLRVVARATGGDLFSTIAISIGETSAQRVIDFAVTEFVIDPALHEPDADKFHTVVVENTGTQDILVTAVCVEIDESPRLGRCYFQNHSFEQGAELWSIAGVDEGVGEVFVADSGLIAQPATLYSDDDPVEYEISVDIGLWYYPDYTPSRTDTVNTVSLSYDFGTFSDVIETVDFATLAIADNDVRLSNTFTVSAETFDDFVISVDVVSDTADVRGVSVRRACIRPVGRDDFPGHDDDGDDGLPFDENCTYAAKPQGNNLGQWTAWHWHNLSQFFECDLMVTLNNMYDLGLWFQATVNMFIEWFGNVFIPWLGGHFANFVADPSATVEEIAALEDEGLSSPQGAGGLSSAQYGTDYDCAWYNIICHGSNLVTGVIDFGVNGVVDVVEFVVTALATIIDILTLGVKTFGDAMQQLWDFGKEIVAGIKDGITFARDNLNELTTKWDSTDPIPPPGLPDCDVDPTGDVCMVFWGMENTLFAGTFGSVIIPLIVSILSVLVFLNFANKFRELVYDSSKSV